MSAMEKKTGSKKSFLDPVKNYFKDVRGEIRKVVWPTFKQVRRNTTVVIVVVIIVGIIIAGLDFLFNNGRNYLINNDSNIINQVTQPAPTDNTSNPVPTTTPTAQPSQAPSGEGSNQ